MRFLIAAALALGLAACEASTTGDAGDAHSEAAASGYTLEIRAAPGEQTYFVTAPDGRMVAARAADGASTLLDAAGVRALAAAPAPQADTEQVMALRLPGFEMSIGAGEGGKGENGSFALSVGGADGERVQVNAQGDGGEGDGSAHVLITGASEESVRQFIAEADRLSPRVQADMLAALGLDDSAPGEEK